MEVEDYEVIDGMICIWTPVVEIVVELLNGYWEGWKVNFLAETVDLLLDSIHFSSKI